MTSPVLDGLALFVRWHPSRVAGYQMLRRELAMEYGADAGAINVGRMCCVCGSTLHGRPRVTEWPLDTRPFVSLARCDDMTVVAWSAVGPVGVDVERHRAADAEGLSRVILHPVERAKGVKKLTRTWVRKESLLKATGRGLSVDPARIRLTGPGEEPVLLAWEAADPPTSPAWLYDVDAGTDHALAVTVLAPTRPELMSRPAAPGAPWSTAIGRRTPPAPALRAPRPGR